MTNPETTSYAQEHKQTPVWKNKCFWHITFLMIACSVFYYMDVIINLGGWVHLKWKIFYTVHDLHRALFLIPAMYAAYEFRLRGIAATSFLSLLIFLPRALVVSPYPDPLLRALIFMISMVIMGVLLSKLLSNISKSKALEQNLLQSHSNLLRIKAEEALRESKDNYKSLIDNIPEIIFTIDLEGKITFVSKKTKEILGYESEETINMNILNFIPEEDHQRAMESLFEGMKGEKIAHFQTPMIAKSGDRLFFDCSFSRIYKDGALAGAQGTAVDITERKRAEEALRESERQFRETVVNLDEGYYSITLDGVLLDHNQSFSRILGFDQAADLKGKHIPDFWQNPDARNVYLQEFAANGFIANYEVNAKTKTGKKIKVIINAHLVKDIDNLPLRIEGVVQDITGRKQAEEALRESERFFKSTIDGLSSHIAVVDDAGEIVLTNKAYRDFAERNGIDPSAVSEGINYLAVCDTAKGEDSEEAGAFAQGIREVLSGNLPSFGLEYPCHSPDEQRWFFGRVTPLTGKVPRQAVVAHDNITARKQAESQREALLDEIGNFNEALEQRINVRTAELEESIALLEEMNRAFVGRELKMMELKERIAELEKQKT